MAIDRAVDSSFLDGGLNNIAAAIRDKTGKSDFLAFPDDFVTEISGITGGGGGYFSYGTFATTDDIESNIVLTHDMGIKPKYFYMISINYTGTYLVRLLSISTKTNGNIEMYFTKPGSSSISVIKVSDDSSSNTGNTSIWYYINYNENIITLKQNAFSNTYGIGKNCEFFWMAFGGFTI